MSKEDTVKITLHLNRKSVDFLKTKARENGIPYQTMIRRIYTICTPITFKMRNPP